MSLAPAQARRRFAVLTFVLAAAAIVLVPRAEARPLITGVTNLGTVEAQAFQQVRATGAGMVRVSLHWTATAPRNRPTSWNPENPLDPHYAWNESDAAVRNALAAGLTPMLIVDGVPRWAQRCQAPAVLPVAVCDPNPTDLRAFATAAASRYSGRTPGVPAVRYFQALNEPNLSLFFFPQFAADGKLLSPYLYRDLLNAFYAGVKAGEPSSLVVAAGLGPNAVPQYTVGPIRFAKAMLCMTGSNRRPRPAPGNCGGGVHLDIFAIQPYTTGGPFHRGRGSDVQLGDLAKLQRLIRAADRANRIKGSLRRTPLWVTEFSWDSRPPDPNGLPMKILTRWVPEALYRAWSAGVSNFFWYSLRDDAVPAGGSHSTTLQSGLYFRGATIAQDRSKSFLQAFRFPFVAYPGKKLRFWGRTPTSRGGKVKIQLRRNGKWRQVTTARADADGIFRGRIATAYGRGKKGAARAVFGGQRTAAFSMRPVRDFFHPPFG